MIANSIADRVAKGVQILNENKPDWRECVDADTLVMESLDDCILGQVFNGWGAGTNALGITGDRYLQTYYGFDLSEDEYLSELSQEFWDELEGAWYSELTHPSA